MEKSKLVQKYPLIPMGEIDDKARRIAVLWGDEYFPGFAMSEKVKLASDIMNYSREDNKELVDLLDEMYRHTGFIDDKIRKTRNKVAEILKKHGKYGV